MYATVNDNSKIGKALEDIELAIVGHVHKPIGRFTINKVDGTSTTMIVPGSLTNTDAGEVSRHDSIDVPIIDIEEDGRVTVWFHTLPLRTNELVFLKKEVSDDARQKLRSLRGNSKEKLYDEMESVTFVGESTGFLSLNAFMKQQGYTVGDKAMIRSVINDPDNINVLLNLYKEDTHVDYSTE